MTPIVNDQYKYIMLYSAKVGCTSMRLLYLSIHADELSVEQHQHLDGYHNLNSVAPYVPGNDYSDYYTFVITRNPYARAVSAFIDQYVYSKNAGVTKMMAAHPPKREQPENFIEFLEYLRTVPDADRDSHFQTQSFFSFTGSVKLADSKVSLRNFFNRLIGPNARRALEIDYAGDLSDFGKHMYSVYRVIFDGVPSKLALAERSIGEMKRRNSSFFGERDFDNAALMTREQLDQLTFSPKPQDFFNSATAQELVQEIYAKDFELFGYALESIPHKDTSKEIASVPNDFDWRMYLRLNPDLAADGIHNERTVLRHYLEFGRFEEIPRAYKIEAPHGFDWRRYLSLHADLPAAGITTEQAAIEHYISYGVREQREI